MTKNSYEYLQRVSAIYQEYILYDEDKKRDLILAKTKQPRIIRFLDDIDALEYVIWVNGSCNRNLSLKKKRGNKTIHVWSKEDHT